MFYSHWGALSVIEDTIAGPQAAVRFVEAQLESRPDQWLGNTWCEGSVLIDSCTRTLLINYGGYEWAFDALELAESVFARTWPGWTMRWALDGNSVLRRHVGLAPLAADTLEPARLPLEPGVDLAHTATVITVANGAHVRAHATKALFENVLSAGPSILDGLADLVPHGAELGSPMGGLHLDPRRKQGALWTTSSLCGIMHALPELWPGWEWTVWGVSPQPHIVATDRAFSVRRDHPDEVADRLKKQLLHSWSGSRMPTLNTILRAIDGPEGTTVEVNPLIAAHNDSRPRTEDRARALAAVTESAGMPTRE